MRLACPYSPFLCFSYGKFIVACEQRLADRYEND